MIERGFSASGCFCSIIAAICPLGILGEMSSIGTLLAFFLVHLSVMIVRSIDSNTMFAMNMPS
jgi:basic amino acid/polyamine antiporter, APA family